MTRDHGGNLDMAIAAFGGTAEGWIDLSTGINRVPYPVPEIPAQAWQVLPRASDMARLRAAAAEAYATRAEIVPLAGAQAAINAVPFLVPQGLARVLSPTYNEHAATLRAAGWEVAEVSSVAALEGAGIAVVVTPNNPDGKVCARETLARVAQTVGLLVVDESFADAVPEASLAPVLHEMPENVLVLRSFGKFYGLAGVRLGFALGRGAVMARLAAQAGPWPVSGPAIEIACAALADRAWHAETVARLEAECAEMDGLVKPHGWRLVGGCALFRTYETADAKAAQRRLAERHVWSRIFPYSRTWIRLGLPGGAHEWARLREVFGQGT